MSSHPNNARHHHHHHRRNRNALSILGTLSFQNLVWFLPLLLLVIQQQQHFPVVGAVSVTDGDTSDSLLKLSSKSTNNNINLNRDSSDLGLNKNSNNKNNFFAIPKRHLVYEVTSPSGTRTSNQPTPSAPLILDVSSLSPQTTQSQPDQNSISSSSSSTVSLSGTSTAISPSQTPESHSTDHFGESAIQNLDYVQYYVVTIAGVCAASISQSSNFYVLYRILSRRRWFESWNQRFPFYLAIQDTLFNVNMIAEWIEILSSGSFPSEFTCKFQGALLNFAIAWHVMLVTFTALTAYIKVYKERQVKYGRFDVWYHLACLSGSALIVSLGVVMDAYGTSSYWCQINMSSFAGRLNMSLLCGMIIASTFITAYCYIKVIAKIKSTFERLQAIRSSTFVPPTFPNSSLSTVRTSQTSSIMPPPSIYGQGMGTPRNSSITSVNKSFRKMSLYVPRLTKKSSVGTLRAITPTPTIPQERTYGWEDEAIKLMCSYIFVFVCQWGPGVLAYILIFSGFQTVVSNTMVVLFVHLGGFFNAIVYLRQHGYFRPKKRPTTTVVGISTTVNDLSTNSRTSSSFYGMESCVRNKSITPPPKSQLSNTEVVIRISESVDADQEGERSDNSGNDHDDDNSGNDDDGSSVYQDGEEEIMEEVELEPTTPPKTPT